MGANSPPAAIDDDLSGIARQLIITSHTRVRCTLNSYGYFCEPRSAGLYGRFLRAIRIFGRGRNGVTLSGDALLDELDQGQRETLVVGQPAERHVQDAQDRRKVGRVRHIFIRQVEAAFVEEADINLLRGARGMNFAIQPDALVGWAQHSGGLMS